MATLNIASSAKANSDNIFSFWCKGEERIKSNNPINFSDWNAAKKEMLTLAISGAASLGLAIWSSIDASRVAKVKNQYYQKLHVAPVISLTPIQGNNLQPTAGLSLSYKF